MTAAASAPVRIAYFAPDHAGRLVCTGSAPVPGWSAPGKVIRLASRRAALPVAALLLPPAIHEAAVQSLVTMLRAELRAPARVET
jgi:hypothetical protein